MENNWREEDYSDNEVLELTDKAGHNVQFHTPKKAFQENDSGNVTQRSLSYDQEDFPPVVPINVGGHLFTTRLSTLRKYSDSMLAAMFSGRHKLDKDAKGNYFIDSDGTYFSHILEFLRHGTLPPQDISSKVYNDACYFNLGELIDKLQLTPYVAKTLVHDAHKALFPDFEEFKSKVIRIAIENSTVDLSTEVVIHAKCKATFPIKSTFFDVNHECIINTSHVTYGPWDTGTTEDQLVRCLEKELQQSGFHIRPFDQKRRCKYYNGMNCQRYVWKIGFFF